MEICSRCKKGIKEDIFLENIEAEELIVCQECYNKHLFSVIKELEAFRNNNKFDKILDLKKKILWISEKMGNWFDNSDKSIQENVSDLDNLNLFELQCELISNLITIIENYIHPKGINNNYEEEIKNNLDLEKLRINLNKQQEKISSYF